MTSRRYKQPLNRWQTNLFPPVLEDFIVENHPVRAIDYYVNNLDLSALGFANTQVSFTAGQPAYAPGTLLKLYIYGYLNRVRSSRRLEHESYRNLEVMWLLEGLKPSYKTMSDFRKVNGQALKAASRDFVVLCKELDLFGGELVAIDGKKGSNQYFNCFM